MAKDQVVKMFMAKHSLNAEALQKILGFKSVNAVYPYIRGHRDFTLNQISLIEKSVGNASELIGSTENEQTSKDALLERVLDENAFLRKQLETLSLAVARLAGIDNVKQANFKARSVNAGGKVIQMPLIDLEKVAVRVEAVEAEALAG